MILDSRTGRAVDALEAEDRDQTESKGDEWMPWSPGYRVHIAAKLEAIYYSVDSQRIIG